MEKNSHRKVWKRFRNNRRGKKKIKRKEDMVREETWKIKIKSKREGQIGIGGDITRSLTLTGRFFWREVDYLQCWFLGCCSSHFSETHPQNVAVSYSKSFFKKYFEGVGIAD